jgi:M6 family metalloprotease-like protein
VIRRSRTALVAGVLGATLFTGSALADGPPPLDPQNWSFQDNLTWADYKPIPGPDYSDPNIEPSVRKWRVALVLLDYPDRPFTITQPPGGTVFGTPTALAHSIPREQVPQFYADFLNKPQPLNNFQTMNRYWMEDSYGRYGVELVPFGPYRLPLNSYQYHINQFNNTTQDCPSPGGATPNPTPCNGNFANAARQAWTADVGQAVVNSFDNIFWVSAGQDESSTWQEFGEMRFTSQDAITDDFGPKHINPLHPRGNWAQTRYVPWTSWASAATVWPSASGNSSTEAESNGMSTYAHELSHNLSIPDNYGNPFGNPQQRGATGMWDMMSRGTFNGPGGQHTRWIVPATQGGALGAQHSIRNKRFLNFISDNDLLRLNRDGLAQTGLAVAEIKAREVAPNGDLLGVRVFLNGAGDTTPPCRYHTDPMCEGPWYTTATGTAVTPRFNDYTLEVVQQIGSDSFAPGHGVMIAKNKNSSSSCGTYNCFSIYLDSNPQDIDQIDFVRADGTPVKAVLGDERQLNDGSFNVGVNSGGEFERVEAGNNLHFYIIDFRTDEDGVLHYTVGVRHTGGSGPHQRGVELGSPTAGTDIGFTTCNFPLKNTGVAAPTPNVHPQDASEYFNSDIYRLSASASGAGWTAHLRNVLATAKFGESTTVPVYIERAPGAAPSGTITLTAKSESDPTKVATATCTVTESTVGGTVPATLALEVGAPADFGPFTPGLQRDYFASTTANVISSAGDATLSVADPSSNATGHLVNGAFSLPEPLQANGVVGTTSSADYAPVGGSTNPTTLLTWAAPVANELVTIGFKQPVKATDPLRTGTYSKTLTFTLSTTNP